MKRIIILFVLIFAVFSSVFTQSHLIQGSAFLDEQSNHSGIEITFERVVPSSLTYTVFTEESGQFSEIIEEGIYTISYQKPNYLSHFLYSQAVYSSFDLPDVTLMQGNELIGQLSGIIHLGYYEVIGNIEVPPDITLVIEPGVTFNFAENTSFDINGLIIAEGNETDSILFTSSSQVNWQGINFHSSSDNNSILSFCIIENSNNHGVEILSANPTIKNSAINNNSAIASGGGIYVYNSSPVLENLKIYDNIAEWGGGLFLGGNCSLLNSYVYNNQADFGGGILCADYEIQIENSILFSNEASNFGGGIYVYSLSYVNINNSTINGNSAGIHGGGVICENASVTISNSIFSNNSNYGMYFGYGEHSIIFSDFWNNTPSNFYNCNEWIGYNVTVNSNNDSIDAYGNMLLNPYFQSSEEGDFHLLTGSPCIDAGNPSGSYPEFDLLGNPRVINAIVDMGPIEHQGDLDITATAQPNIICLGDNSQLSANATGGSGSYTFSWTSNPPGFTSNIPNPIVSPTETTEYTVEVSDGTTTNDESVIVTVNYLPEPAQEISGPTDVCRGGQNIIYSVPEIEYTDSYLWSLPTGFIITSGNNTNSIEVTIGSSAVSGQITVEGVNDCGTGNSSTLDVSVHYVTADAGTDQTIVYGTSTALSGNAENGSGDYSWNWEPVSMLLDANIQNPETVALETNTEFTLTVTDNSYGCTDDDQMNVFVETEELTVVAIVDPEEIEWNETAQLDAIVTGGLIDYNFSWTSYPEGFTSDIQNPEVSPDFTTVYHIDVNDGESTVSDSVMLIVYVAPAIPNQPIGPDSVELANNETAQYFTPYIPGALTYHWNLNPENAGTLGPNENNVLINWNPNFAGWCYLSVNAINEYGESEYSEVLEIYIDYVINTNSLSYDNISIFPNPTKNELYIRGGNFYSEYLIKNSIGEIISKGQIKNEPNFKINTEKLKTGLYFIQFANGKDLKTKKFIKN